MKPLSQINVIPFIDIMLVLLAVVLTTATFVAHNKIPLVLPQTENGDASSNQAATELSIDAKGALFFDQNALSLADLAQKLAALPKNRPILLRVDEQAAFGHFVAVVDLLKTQQLNDLSIITQPAKP